MQSTERLYFVLGCLGRNDDGFVSCGSVQNKILLLSEDLINYTEIIEYLDAIKLFDKPLLDINAIRNCIFKMQDRYEQGIKKLWSEKEFRLYESFILSHKSCGLFLQLRLLDESHSFIEEEEEKPVMVRVVSKMEEAPKPPNLTVIRGRR